MHDATFMMSNSSTGITKTSQNSTKLSRLQLKTLFHKYILNETKVTGLTNYVPVCYN